ncbi:MAG: right-handed parallel beta-helix repeat-containing protein [Ignavibacteriaceae bacterium]
MKFRLYISLPILFLLVSCVDREQPDDPTGPGITGIFTEISGRVSGTLNLNDSPYKVVQDIIVDSGKTLIISGGVEIYFTENKQLIVYGELQITGDYNHDQIKLEAYDTTKSWQGIKIINADKPASIDFANIKGIRKEYDSNYVSASISVTNSELTVKHSIIYSNSAIHGGAIGIYNGKLIVHNSVFRDNKADVFGGAIISELSDVQIVNNTFYNNYSYNGVGGVLIYDPLTTEVQNNIFYKNSSRTGNPHFYFQSADSSALIEEYNFFAYNTMDPIFWNDFYLDLFYTSPCKDAGNPDQIFYDYNGTRNDQGAYGGPGGKW